MDISHQSFKVELYKIKAYILMYGSENILIKLFYSLSSFVTAKT